VKQLSSEMSPGPDRYIGTFFKQCWDIIGHDVTLRDLFPSRTNAGTYSTLQTSLYFLRRTALKTSATFAQSA
jgi:hypothetical protein